MYKIYARFCVIAGYLKLFRDNSARESCAAATFRSMSCDRCRNVPTFRLISCDRRRNVEAPRRIARPPSARFCAIGAGTSRRLGVLPASGRSEPPEDSGGPFCGAPANCRHRFRAFICSADSGSSPNWSTDPAPPRIAYVRGLGSRITGSPKAKDNTRRDKFV